MFSFHDAVTATNGRDTDRAHPDVFRYVHQSAGVRDDELERARCVWAKRSPRFGVAGR
jgi:hypothetical protein